MSRAARQAARRIWLPLGQLRAKLSASSFQEQTGLEVPQPWEAVLAPHVINGFRVARAAMRLSPRFVFGHEVVAYGYAAARCPGIPRILFPWGADVMTTAEVSRWHFRLVRYALRSADLVVPSSTTAARHLSARFGADPGRVQAISWGVNLRQFTRLDPAERLRVCGQWGIDPAREVVMNVRRFLPLYNCRAAVEAFLAVARLRPSTHFVLLGGLETDAFVDEAVRRVEQEDASVVQRFTFLRANVSMTTCADLMGIADVAVSLCGRGDMRSKSVLEAAACGGALVLSDQDEYRYMTRDGFTAEFVDPRDVDATAAAVLRLVDHPEARADMGRRNRQYVESHEDTERQMDKLLSAVLSVKCHAHAV